MQIGLQAYVTGSNEAVEFYCKAFGAELGYHVKNPDGTYIHAETFRDGQTILAVSEAKENAGANMQFCLNFGKENLEALTRAYKVLSEGGQVRVPLGPCDWNEAMADVTDKFGVRWYIAL